MRLENTVLGGVVWGRKVGRKVSDPGDCQEAAV